MMRRWHKFVVGCLLAAGCFLSSSAFATLQPPTPTCSKGTYSSYVHVSWSYVSGATTGYVIWRNTSSNFNTATRMTTTAAGVTSWNDWSVSTGKTYYYWVCPRDSSYTWWYNTSRWDTGWAQYVFVPTPTCSKGTYSSYVHLTWSSSSTEKTGYVIWRNTSSNFNTATRMTTTSHGVTSWNDWSVNSGTTYYYWVCPRDSSYTWWYNTANYGTGWSQYVYVPTPTCSKGTYSSYVHLSWSSSSTEKTGYVIWRNTSSNFNTATRMTTTSHGVTYWNDYSVTPGVTYYYWVCPRDSSYTWWYDTSKWGKGWAYVDVPTPYASWGTYTYIHLTWPSSSTEKTGYVIWRNTSSNFNTAQRMTTTAHGQTYWNDYSVKADTIYYYWVCPRDANYTWWYNTSKWDIGKAKASGLPVPIPTVYGYSGYNRVLWSSISGATTGYVIFRNTSSSFSSATRMTTVSAGTTAWNDWSAAPYVTYYYWVCPRDSNYTYWYNPTAYDWNWCY